MGVYVHIPFCVSHCTYCGFYSELLPCRQGSEAVIDTFVEALCREIALGGPCCGGDTIYFGGGTPSVLGLQHLGKIVAALGSAGYIASESNPCAEMTIEVNPDDIVRRGEDYVAGLRDLGFDRVSMGVQSLDGKVLRRMGRRHDAAQALRAFAMLREAGFENISVDFIFGFTPGLPPIGESLERLGDAPASHRGLPEHVSCYQLSIEPGSGLEKMISRGMYCMPSDEQCAGQYASICAALRDLGYEHYEISNWAARRSAAGQHRAGAASCPRSPFRSRHNSSYWHHTPYIGFGPGAHSFTAPSADAPAIRRWNNTDLNAYLCAARSGEFASVRGSEELTPGQIAQERIMLGLRTCDGIPYAWIPPETAAKTLGCGSLEFCGDPSGQGERYVRIPEAKWFISDDIILSL